MTITNEILKPLCNENEEQYIWRIGKEVDKGTFSWVGITPTINAIWRGEDKSKYRDESSYRKKYQIGKLMYQNVFSMDGTDVHRRILCVSDLHVPFHKPLTVFSDYCNHVDTLVINGDVQDCQSISKFSKSYRLSFKREMIAARSYLIGLIQYINPKEVYINSGNHEDRLGSYLAKNLDSDVNSLMPDSPLELIVDDGFTDYDKQLGEKTYYKPLVDIFPDKNIVYTRNWWCKIGETIFCHPKAFSSTMMKTAEKAMTFFRNEGIIFDALCMAHTHRIGSYKIGNTVIYEQGCCCETEKMRYSDGALTLAQQEGFLYLCQDINGKLIKDTTKLVYIENNKDEKR